MKPTLPDRNKSVPVSVSSHARKPPPPLPKKPGSGGTMPIQVISSKPILPPRVPSRQTIPGDAPLLPTRPVLPSRTSRAPLTLGRTRKAIYEEREFGHIDEYVRELPEYPDIASLAHALTVHFDDEVDQCRALFSWISFNIAYDWSSFTSSTIPNQDANSVFKTKKGVCAGYAGLFQELCNQTRIKCLTISGFGKGVGFDPSKSHVKGINHAWNAVWVGGEWRMIESTWSSGAIMNNQFIRKFNPYWFLVDPEEFIVSHMPTTDHQFIDPKTWHEFFSLVNFHSTFWRDLILRSHIGCGNLIRIDQNEECRISFTGSRKLSVTSPFPSYVTQINNEIEVSIRPQSPGTETMSFFSEGTYFGSFTLLIQPSSREPLPGFPMIYASEYAILSPLVDVLRIRETYEFIVQCDCEEEFWIYTDRPESKLRREGSVYRITKHIVKGGDLKIGVKKGNSYSFLGLWKI